MVCTDIHFQYEPIAAAFDYEARLTKEGLVLVADIGGGTSDFSLVRVGPERAQALSTQKTTCSRITACTWPERTSTGAWNSRRSCANSAISRSAPEGREVPNRVYFDLATWHLINTVYAPKRVSELQLMRHLYTDSKHHDRLMRVVERRLGHALASHAEDSEDRRGGGRRDHDRAWKRWKRRCASRFDEQQLIEAGQEETRRIVEAARETVQAAGVAPRDVGAIYFTGGSTGLAFPVAFAVRCVSRRLKRYSATGSPAWRPASAFTRGAYSVNRY